MSMLDALIQSGGPQAISRELGIDQETARTGMSALLPAVLGGMQNQAGGGAGLGGLGSILGGLGGGGLLDNVLAPEPTNVSQGNEVLEQLFGSKDTSRAVAQHASAQTGLDPGLLKKMLPIVAMLAAGYFAKRAHGRDETGAGGSSGLGGVLGSLLGGGGGGGNALNSIIGGLAGGRF